ncbi:HNH endonuclease signature motif containing protein, partial [Nesterenkonia sp. K-15-9-6]|uniref:HNH endonuclease signature motif containing protein n=1 Tax=Nesterenkonia sp. K-15-9-6 TaxID=3093918 RepID=UPI00404488ED
DRNWVIPASDARHLAGDPRTCHDWYQATTGPHQPGAGDVSPDILSITYTGRYAPARLRDAIIFRDGVCQAPGCTIPAQRCDLDHRLPYPAGPTSGPNLQALCRRHHRLKSHGLLTSTDDPPTALNTPAPPKTGTPPNPPPTTPSPPSIQRPAAPPAHPDQRRRGLPPAWQPTRRRTPAPHGRVDLIATHHATPGSRRGVTVLYETSRRRH